MVCPFHRELKPISADFHPFDPAQKANPYPLYARAHEESPVFFSPDINMWVVTKHKDIMEIARDPERFSSMGFTDRIGTLVPEALAILAEGRPMLPTLINNDAPAHSRIRALCNKAFTPRRVAGMEPTIRELAHSLVDEFAHEGHADIIARFAFHLPRIIIGDIVGVPREDIPLWGTWADQFATLPFEELTPDKQIEGARGTVALQRYNQALIDDRRRNPKDDFVTDLVRAREDGTAPLTDDEVNMILITFLVAGHRTVTDFIGNALTILSRHPEKMDALARDPSLSAEYVEEILRYESPAPGLPRRATQDVMIGDTLIPAGEQLYVVYAAANRDHDIFQSADEFDPQRDNLGNHLAFGRGPHYCIGSPLARLEARVVLEVLTQRLPRLRVVPGQNPLYSMNITFRGPTTLQVAWDAERAVAARQEASVAD